MTLTFPKLKTFGTKEITMKDPEHEEFMEICQASIRLIEANGGEGMLNSIRSSKNIVSVIQGFSDNDCIIDGTGEHDQNNSCYREILDHRSLISLLEELESKESTRSDTKVQHARRKYDSGNKHKTPSKDTYRPPQVVNKPVKPGITLKHFDMSPSETQAINLATRLECGRIGYWLMEHMHAGPGSNAKVKWLPKKETVDSKIDADWNTRPPWIALAHELIHAWRIVTGRVVFHPSQDLHYYYEEAMTVGFAPYDRCEFTENKFRLRAEQPRRSYYGPSTKLKTESAAARHSSL